MNETAFAALILATIVSSAGMSGNFVSAKTTPIDLKPNTEKKMDNAKALADEARKKILEKAFKDSTAKKNQKLLELQAIKAKILEDAKKAHIKSRK
jgi:hypothetical protein